jgi:hypothetical protein
MHMSCHRAAITIRPPASPRPKIITVVVSFYPKISLAQSKEYFTYSSRA